MTREPQVIGMPPTEMQSFSPTRLPASFPDAAPFTEQRRTIAFNGFSAGGGREPGSRSQYVTAGVPDGMFTNGSNASNMPGSNDWKSASSSALKQKWLISAALPRSSLVGRLSAITRPPSQRKLASAVYAYRSITQPVSKGVLISTRRVTREKYQRPSTLRYSS